MLPSKVEGSVRTCTVQQLSDGPRLFEPPTATGVLQLCPSRDLPSRREHELACQVALQSLHCPPEGTGADSTAGAHAAHAAVPEAAAATKPTDDIENRLMISVSKADPPEYFSRLQKVEFEVLFHHSPRQIGASTDCAYVFVCDLGLGHAGL